MWGTDFSSVVSFFVAITVACRASHKRGIPRPEVRALVFRMTGHAADAGVLVRFYHRGCERLRLVAGRALLFHGAAQRMTAGARVCDGSGGNWGRMTELRSCVDRRNRGRRKRVRIPE